MQNFTQTHTLANGLKLLLRTPQLGDAQGLIDHLKRADSETRFLAREAGEFNFTLEQETAFIKQSLENDSRFFIVSEVDGKIAGTCGAEIISGNKRFRHRASMGIALCKDYWHLGIGSKMMGACIAWCREKGLEQLELEVVTENISALSMYEKFGFKTYGTKKNAMKYSDGTYGDEYFMILFLNA